MPSAVSLSVSTRRALVALAGLAMLTMVLTGRAHAEALLAVDADTGKVLHAENATHPWYPASVTKLMTAYVVLRAVKERRMSLDKLLTVSATAAAQQPSKMGFRAGTQVTVDNALKMMMVKSANDMAVVLAEGTAGSIENFADEMNRTARRLGMVQTTYVNPNGLPAEGQVTSARDLAILARAIIRDLPDYEYYMHIPAIKFGRRVTRNFNMLIGRYPGADGMKTGFICASGFNLVASATRNGRRIIAVVLGASSGPVRAVKAAQLLERGFSGQGLAWLTPSLGSLDGLAPMDALPPNLRDEMCGPQRKRPAADSMDEAETGSDGALGLFAALGSQGQKPSSLLADIGPVEPVVVYAGPKRSAAEVAAETERDAQAAAAAAAAKSKGKAKRKPAVAEADDGSPPAGKKKSTKRDAATADKDTKPAGAASAASASAKKPARDKDAGVKPDAAKKKPQASAVIDTAKDKRAPKPSARAPAKPAPKTDDE